MSLSLVVTKEPVLLFVTNCLSAVLADIQFRRMHSAHHSFALGGLQNFPSSACIKDVKDCSPAFLIV
jgi:hypothetical protein